MARKYFTLAARDDDHSWSPQFGDYDRSVVEDEMRDWIDAGSYAAKNLRIITTAAAQTAINDGVAKLNASWRTI